MTDAPKSLRLIDGSSLVYRAFFALPESIATSTGEPTNAIFGFCSMLIKLIDEHGDEPTVVVWDRGHSGRKELHGDYKANRSSRPDLLREQWEHIPEMVEAYTALHRLGWAHSVEVWDGEELVGGIYGIAIGGAFAGESMFHARTDASKIAFANLVEHLRAGGFTLFDVQVMNPHLESLGCVEIARGEYLAKLVIAQAAGPRRI